MERIPEQELMIDEAHVRAYAEADFSETHDAFVADYQAVFGGDDSERIVLDLGCGPCDVVIRMCRSFLKSRVHAVDGSLLMLQFAQEALADKPDVSSRVELIHGVLPDVVLPRETYDAVISNSLLHHLRDPGTLWAYIKRYARHKARVYVVDLIRPKSTAEAVEIVERYSANEPKILKGDFYRSLLAAYTVDEIRAQLQRAGLDYFNVRQISVCHMAVSAEMA